MSVLRPRDVVDELVLPMNLVVDLPWELLSPQPYVIGGL